MVKRSKCIQRGIYTHTMTATVLELLCTMQYDVPLLLSCCTCVDAVLFAHYLSHVIALSVFDLICMGVL